MTDITLLTDSRYVNPSNPDWYVQNILEEDRLLRQALEQHGLKINRINWDDPSYNWKATRFALFRTTWDYFNRFPEFSEWLQKVRKQTHLINPCELILWNLDKHYLHDLRRLGIAIPPTLFLEPGDERPLTEIVRATGWSECILKPAVSGAARHTYRFRSTAAPEYESIYRQLIENESMLLQEFQQNVLHKGEVAFMVFGGKFTHAVLKRARPGDFRVQDDFGGSVHPCTPTPEEVALAERVVSVCQPVPVYARVDILWSNHGEPCVSELELIEPELWFRMYPPAAQLFAEALLKYINEQFAG
ncbi:MAG: hypothetical protein KatS3mg032_1853 [Cyclobacteriaceae bacterium]|nr:MAG: hypothetical protein KatS3mg032_1853 [Cyclobacteriaceae bacterium]